jgi:transposase-like protein
LDIQGKKDLLGIYLSEREGAKFWLQVLIDLVNRGESFPKNRSI